MTRKLLLPLFAALLLLVPLCAEGQQRLPKRKIIQTAKPFRGHENFEVVKLLSLLVVDYEDADPADKDSFERRISRILEDQEPILRVKEDGEETIMFANVSKNGKTMSNFLLFSPSEASLVMIGGTIPVAWVMSHIDE